MNFMPTTTDFEPVSRDYARIAAAIRYIVKARAHQPALDDIAAHVGLSTFHLQRMFKRWAGVSPKQLMGYLTLEHAKAVMRRSASVLDAAYEIGLSGPSRLHDLFVTVEAMSPGEYKACGAGLEIRHGVAATPFGPALILSTGRGICGVEFIDDDASTVFERVRAEWPLGRFVADPAHAADLAQCMFGTQRGAPLRLLMRGTNFQVQVWSALLRVPSGAMVSYGDVANAIRRTGASRAVGTALSRNPLAYVVPCHRVLRETALANAYKWGGERRSAILAWEAAAIAGSNFAGSIQD